jgi:hypothetical protein
MARTRTDLLSPSVGVLLAATATAVQAALVISPTGPTTNVSCASHVCTATAADAVLAVSRVKKLLATGSLKVATGSAAEDIEIDAAFSWTSAGTLTLDAQRSIAVNNPITVSGPGGLTIVTNDGGTGGTFSFGGMAHVKFWSVTNALTINGNAYTLVDDIATLADDIASNPAGFYALAANYDATPDGSYSQAPISTIFTGTFEGLGNTISHLRINATNNAGLFAETDYPSLVENLGLSEVNAEGVNSGNSGGLVAYLNGGSLFGDHVGGQVTASNAGATGGLVGQTRGGDISHSYSTATVLEKGKCLCDVGGLVGGFGGGTIETSYATGTVTGQGESIVGGLIGSADAASVDQCYATGAVKGGWKAIVGGFVGQSGGHTGANGLTNDYATGGVTGGLKATVGGFVGQNRPGGLLADSYSIGAVSGQTGSVLGGFVGEDISSGLITDSYWDTTTSGITNLSQGAGNISNDPGITGMTTSQLQAGLPAGFSNSIWGESVSINGGLPFLLGIPPG